MRTIFILLGLVSARGTLTFGEEFKDLAKTVTLYASFDRAIRAEYAKGDPRVYTQFDSTKADGEKIRRAGVSPAAFRIKPSIGRSKGALEATQVLPHRGRLMFRAKDNLSYLRTGSSGSISVWIKINPDTDLITPFCDPIQITQKNASDGGLWIDFPKGSPRSLRLGAFKALAPGEKAIKQTAENAPLITIPKIGFKNDDWHHLVVAWNNLDSGKPNAHIKLLIDGKSVGELKNRNIAMKWDLHRTSIYFAVNFIGLMDELAIFSRALTPSEVELLYRKPVGLKMELLVGQRPKVSRQKR